MVRSSKRVEAMQLMTASMSILGPQGDIPAFSEDIVDGYLKIKCVFISISFCLGIRRELAEAFSTSHVLQ